jgi:hypothetical protein
MKIKASIVLFQSLVLVVASALFSLSAAAQCSDLRFAFQSNPASPGTSPFRPVTGDFNRDGNPDAVWPNSATDNITVVLGNGNGGFAAPTNLAVGDFPERIAIGDLNRDGRQDLAVRNFLSANISVLFGNANGTFTAATTAITNVPSNGSGIAIRDINRDGIEDIVVSRIDPNSFQIHIGNGSGGFVAQPTIATDGLSSDVAVGDVNRDGRDDIVLSQPTLDRVALFLGNGSGTTFGTQNNFGVGDSPRPVSLVDLNNDAAFDLIVGYEAASGGSNDVSVLLNNGSGGFGAVSNYPTSQQTRTVDTGDFNGDGNPDIAVGRPGSQVVVLQNDGDGTFGAAAFFAVGGIQSSVAVDDFNNDGKDDIFATQQGNNTFGVLRNTCFGDKPDIDFTGDGKADIAVFRPSNGNWFVLRSEDNSFFAIPWGVNGDIPAAADYDGDGKSDFAVFRPTGATWFISRSTDGGATFVQFGLSSDTPTPKDYDGDGKADIAIFRPNLGEWWMLRSKDGSVFATPFGTAGDIPIR